MHLMVKKFLLLLLFPIVFHQQYFAKFLFRSLLNSLLKSEDIAKVHDQILLHATILQAVFQLPEEFQCNISAEIRILC